MRELVLLLAMSSVAAGGTIADGIADARYRVYGETFAEYTCRLVGRGNDGQQQGGTCTLISPHWALTAAHVVVDAKDSRVLTAAGEHPIDRVFVPRGHDGTFGEHDIALVHVSRPFEAELYPPLTDGSEEVGSVCTACGYGLTGRLSAGYGHGDNALRAGTMRITSRERCVYVCEIKAGGSPLPFCIAPGDSGGPLWGRAADGRTVLIGVNSYTAKLGKGPVRSRVGEESGHTRVEAYLEWIAEVVGELDGPCTLAECQER